MKSGQRGYLIEIPIAIAAVLVVLAWLIPKLPPAGAKLLAGFGALALCGGAYYMLIVPGWQPNASRLRSPWNWLVFVVIAAALLAAAGAFAIAG